MARSFPPPRRVTQWGNVMLRTAIQGQGASTGLGTVNVGAEFLVAATLTRIRGNASVRIIPNVAGASMIVGLGLVLVSGEAFAAGAASMPSPTDAIDFSWIWHQLFVFPPSVSTEVVNELGSVQEVVIDAKAQRKVRPGDTLAFVWDGIITTGAPVADGIAAIRHLVLLS